MLIKVDILLGVLHVSYAPEYETVEDVRSKIKGRKRDVHYRLKKLHEEESQNNSEIDFSHFHEPYAKRAKPDFPHDKSAEEMERKKWSKSE